MAGNINLILKDKNMLNNLTKSKDQAIMNKNTNKISIEHKII